MSTDTFDNPFTPSAAFRKKGKHVPIDRAAELFETAFHESGHGLSRLVLGIPISWVVIQSRGGQINAPACNTSAYTGFEALMGMACEEARGHDGARARRDMDAACLDLGPLDGQDDDVPEVLEMAREFVREIRGTLEETAKQLLACKPKNGRIQGRHLQAILDDARPAVLAAAERIRLVPRLDAIQARREARHRALRANRTYPPEFLEQVRALGWENLFDEGDE